MGGGGVYTVPPSPSAHVKIKDALSAITSFGYIVCSKSLPVAYVENSLLCMNLTLTYASNS